MQITVVIPLYNKQNTILRALNSVLDQRFKPTEILVINDGSTDGSEKIVEKFLSCGVRIINQQNAGVSAARNRGVAEAKCEWVAFLDADDEWLPDFLINIVDLNKTYPRASVLATAYYNCYSGLDKKQIKLNKVKPYTNQMLDYFKVSSFSSPPVWSSAVVINRDKLLSIGGFPIGIVAGEDLLTWAKLAKSNDIAYSTSAFANYYIENELVYRKERLKSIIENNRLVSDELTKLLDISEKYERFYLAEWYKIISNQYLKLSLNKEAFDSILKSIHLRPLRGKIYIYMLLLIFPYLRRRILK